MNPIALIIPIHYEQHNVTQLLKNISSKIKIPIVLYFIYDDDKDPSLKVISENIKNYNFIFRNKFSEIKEIIPKKITSLAEDKINILLLINLD